MTSAHFDAPASSTPRHIAAFCVQQRAPRSVEQRIVRLVWLTARLVRRDSVSYDDCRRRFNISLRTFHRDIAALRDAGLYIAAEPNNYRMMCFVSDTDAA
jgi:predicted DNA-binding transcriptional regulator YafY